MDLHTTVFLIVSVLSVLHSVCIAKIEILSAIYDQGTYSALALSGFWTLGKLTAISILGCEQEKIERLLESMKKYEKTFPILRAHSGALHKMKYLMYFAIGSTFVTVAMEIWTIYNLGLGEALLVGSHTLSKCLFLWTDGNLSEKAFLLKFEYGSELTVMTALMGGIFIASEIISILHTGMVLGFMMLVSVAMHTYFAELIKDIREFSGDRRTEKVEEWKRNPVKILQFWRKLRMLQNVFELANDAFYELFKLILAVGLLCIGDFMSISFLGTRTINRFIFLVHLVLVEVWFLYAAKIAEQNKELCEWIGDCGLLIGSVRVDGVVVDPRVLLEELENEPIGLGQARFIMQKTPHYWALKIFNRVWSAIIGDGNDNN